ncbi:unnamed protein product [Brachionus calyciflorus]|uniref:Uncharacterized protein n=1 Tax=Brachionus calyciflorus TaxID=104777 RepID=A0A814DDW8_9BILA|nr:unnamed protein product [Brachionus calyciflorus]
MKIDSRILNINNSLGPKLIHFNKKNDSLNLNFELIKSKLMSLVVSSFLNDLSVYLFNADEKLCYLDKNSLNLINYEGIVVVESEQVDAGGEKSESGKKSNPKEEKKKEEEQKEDDETANGANNGDHGEEDDGNEEKRRWDKRNSKEAELDEEDESSDEDSDLEDYTGDYSESDEPKKRRKDIKKAKKIRYRTEESPESEYEIEYYENPRPSRKSTRYRPSRRRRDESEEMSERSDEEKDIIHRYYQKIRSQRGSGGHHDYGFIIKKFPRHEREIIHDFLSQIGSKGRRARTRKEESESESESLSGLDIRSKRHRRGESPEYKKRNRHEKEIISKYYHDIGSSRGESRRHRRGEFISKYPKKEQDVIHKFLSETGSRGRRTRMEIAERQQEEEEEKESEQQKSPVKRAEKKELHKQKSTPSIGKENEPVKVENVSRGKKRKPLSQSNPNVSSKN